MIRRGGFALATMLLLSTGCASTHEDEVLQVAERLHAAIRDEDGVAACQVLSQEVQKTLQETGDSCQVAVLEAGLSPVGRVAKVSVYDTSAQVRYDDDIVFLADFPEGWKVIAAGCVPQPADAPYDCKVQGG